MKLEILKDFGSQKKGEKIELSEKTAEPLFKKGLVREIKPRKTKEKVTDK